ERALTVAWFAGYHGFTVADLVRGAGLGPGEAEQLVAELKKLGELVDIGAGHNRQLLLHRDVLAELDDRILPVLPRMHEGATLVTWHDRHKVQAQLDYVADQALVHAAVEHLLQEKTVVGDARHLARADFKPKLSANLRKLKDKVVAAYHDAGFQPPDPS